MRIKLFSVAILLLFSVSGVCGFEDTVQRPVPYDVNDLWYTLPHLDSENPLLGESTVGGGSAGIINDPVTYPTANCIHFIANAPNHNYDLTTKELISTDYIAFTIHYMESTGRRWYINFFDVYGNRVIRYYMGSQYSQHSRYEIVREGSNMNLYIDGVFYVNLGTMTDDYALFGLETRGYSTTPDYLGEMHIDDITTSSIIGMNEEWTQAATYIDTSYGIQSYASFPSSTFTMTSTQVGTGTLKNTTTLTSIADFVRWNRTEIYGSGWGLYHVQLFRDSTKLAETTFTYFDSTISGSVAYDQDSYTQGQTANIAYTISSADFTTYTYYLKTMDVYGNIQDSYTLTAASGTKSPTLTDYDSGIYYAILSRTNKASGVNEEFAYDYTSVTETVYIVGNVTEAVSGTNMQNVSIQYLQGSAYYNTTSASDGSYNVSDLSVSVSTAITANVTYVNDTNYGNNSYNLSTFSFTPLAAEMYNVDLILFDVNHTYDNASAYGLIYDNIYHQPIESATVNIYNSTWSNSTTSTGTGYYVFHNLIANGTYSINATATGYIDTIDYSINTTTLNATRQDVPMSTLYTVTVKARDATTLAYLSDFTATLDGVEGTAVNGTVIFNNIEYGLHAISAIASDYYPSATTPLIDEDTEVILDLTRLASEYYAPHRVKFTLKSLFLTRYGDVETTVYIGATASGDAYKTGTTGTDGAVVFELDEYVQYTLTFIDSDQGIDETITLYPKDDAYTVYTGVGNLIDDLLNPDDEEQAITAIDVSISKTIINDNTANITVNYNDIMDETSGLTLTLSQSIDGNITNNTILATTSLGTLNNTAYNFTVTNYNGESYFITITATHTTHGSISRLYGVQFENTATQFGFAGEVVGWLAIIFLIWFSLTATQVTVPHTAIGVCALATVLMALGWGQYLSTAGLALAWIMSLAANFAVGKEASS